MAPSARRGPRGHCTGSHVPRQPPRRAGPAGPRRSLAPAGRHHWGVPLFAFHGRAPQISPQAWIAPTATLVGEVYVEAEASIWYGAVLRADFGAIVVRRGGPWSRS